MSAWNYVRNCKSILVLALVACVLAVGAPASAAIVYVDNSLGTNGSGTSPGDAVNNIQDALTWSSNGDVLWIATGVYNEGVISVTKELTFAGGFAHGFASRALDATPTTITGNNVSIATALIRVPGTANVKFDGLSVVEANNGATSGGSEYHKGGAMYLNNVDTVVTSCTFMNNTIVRQSGSNDGNSYDGGGAISIQAGTPWIENCTFDSNSASGWGAAGGHVYAEGATDFDVVNSRFFRGDTGTENSYGIGVSVMGGGATVRIANCIFADMDTRAAVNVRYSTSNMYINSCTFYDCSWAAIYNRGGGATHIVNSLFDNCAYVFRNSYDNSTACDMYLSNSFVSRSCGAFLGGSTTYNLVVVTPNYTSDPAFGGSPSVRLDAMLADPANGDFTPQPWSALLDAALTTDSLPAADIDGNARTDGNAFSAGVQADIGAVEGAASANSWDPLHVYIKTAASGTGFGTDWANAGAIDLVANGADDAAENATIWLGEGDMGLSFTYYPAEGSSWIGGFPTDSIADPDMGDRAPFVNETILDYDAINFRLIDKDDVTLDGIVFTGSISSWGGAIVLANSTGNYASGLGTYDDFCSNFQVKNCTFREGGMSFWFYGGMEAILTDCRFYDNTSSFRGSAFYSRCEYNHSILRATGCTFANNVCTLDDNSYGAGVADLGIWKHTSEYTFDDCVFVNNSRTAGPGGAIRFSSNPTAGGLTNCLFVNNSAASGSSGQGNGGAVYATQDGVSIDVANCTFVGNQAEVRGAAIGAAATGDMAIVNCLFSGNTSIDNLAVTNVNSGFSSNNLFYDQAGPTVGLDVTCGDPDFADSGIAGSLTAVRTYANGATYLVDSGASFTPDALVGMVIRPDNLSNAYGVVIANTATEIWVTGDFSGAASDYEVMSYMPGSNSKAIDRGASSFASVTVPGDDIAGTSRGTDGDGVYGGQYDIGAYEAPAGNANSAVTWRLKVDGTGLGTSWADAAGPSFLLGLANVRQGDTVWVAQGTYNMGGANILTDDDQKWYGGFANTGDPGIGDRNPLAYPTIVDGGGSTNDMVQMNGVSNVLVDGFALQNANTALLVNNADNCVARNMAIRDNAGTAGCGTQVSGNTSFTLASSWVMNNVGTGTSGYGAGMYITNGPSAANPNKVNVVDTKFIGNEAACTYDGRAAAAIQINAYYAHLSVDRSVFAGNRAIENSGGGGCGAAFDCRYGNIGDGDSVRVWFTNSIFAGNKSDRRGGAIFHYENPDIFIVNCTFVDNEAGDQGGAAHLNDGGSKAVVNCIFMNNQEPSGNGLEWNSNPNGQDFSNNLHYLNTCNYYGTDDQTGVTPAFLAGATGTWSAVSVDGSGDWTLLTDAGASFTPGALVGSLINPDGDQLMHTMITSNSATQVIVAGGAFGATSGDAYNIPNYTPGPGSAAIDKAIATSPSPADFAIPTVDINDNARDFDQPLIGGTAPGGAYEIGAVEARTAYTVPIVTYVNDDAAPGGDGSIGSPFQTIGDATAGFTEPYAPGWAEIYVATGVYPETVDVAASPDFRGGFSEDFSSRDVAATPTTIDGQKTVRTRAMVAFSGDARFDGFTVTNGHNSASEGGAMRVINCSPIITSCTLFNNYCQTSNYMRGGGGVYLAGGSVNGAVLAGCTVTSNTSYNTNPSGSGTAGAGVSIYGSAEVEIDGCFISANRSIGWNSAYSNEIMAYSNSVATVRNTVFKPTANFATYVRGGSTLSLYNCTIAGIGTAGVGWRDTGITINVFNTIFDNCGYGFRSVGGGAVVSIGNNLFNDVTPAIDLPTANDTVIDFGGNISKYAAYGGSAATETYPAFIEPDADNYRIGLGSPATDVGLTSDTIPAFDADMNARGHDVPGVGLVGGVDIGAYELLATSNVVNRYVNDDAAPGGDGSLAAPLTSIAHAVNSTGKGPGWIIGSIYVAGGDYYEQVLMRAGMKVRGGYAEDFASRDIATWPSVIDGQDQPRAQALVVFNNADDSRIDGFTVTNAYTTGGDGGGVFMNCVAVVSSCTIADNLTTGAQTGDGGGGVMFYGSGCTSQTMLANCVVENNIMAAWNSMGGGITVLQGAKPTIMDSIVTNNNRMGQQWYGSCIGVVNSGSHPTVVNCVFADSYDRLLYVRGGAAGTFVNCTILGHASSASYGLGIRDGGNQVAMVNCIFDNLTAAMYGSVQDASRTGNEIYVAGSLFNDCGSFMPGAFFLGTATTLLDGGGNVSEYSAIGGSGGTDTDPLFMPIAGQSWSFILGPGSAAIDAGISSSTVPGTDILALARDGSPDIGANEYQASGLAPIILSQPANVVVDPGIGASLSVVAVGSPLLAYQWEFNDGSGWVNVGENGAILTIDTAAEADEGSYRVTITNDEGSVVSSVVTLTVNDPPVITVEPVSVHTTPGSSASFSVTVTGTAPMTFQWQKDGALADIDSDHVVTSTDTGSTYLFTDVQPDDPGVYRVQVTNSAGMARSVYVVLSVDGPVLVLRQPTTQTTSFGADATFTIFVSGSQPMTYAWTRNGLPLSDGGNVSGATTNELTIDPVDWADAMGVGYQVTVTNAFPGSGVSPIVGIRLLPTGVSPWWEMMK